MMKLVVIFLGLLFSQSVFASTLKVGDVAPEFSAKTHEGKDFNLQDRKGSWTVLYFYPKSETPGCTKQACAFRDSIENIRKEGAEVFGISVNTVGDQAQFHSRHELTFTILADPDAKVVELYGTKMPVLKMSKRWTFIIGPDLKIKDIEKDVDPAMDSVRVAKKVAELKAQK